MRVLDPAGESALQEPEIAKFEIALKLGRGPYELVKRGEIGTASTETLSESATSRFRALPSHRSGKP